jgi:hypothetical protein
VLHANDGFGQTFHAVDNHRCDIDGDRATGVTYCLARHYREADGTAEVIITPLRYCDTYRRTPHGWRFASRAPSHAAQAGCVAASIPVVDRRQHEPKLWPRGSTCPLSAAPR